MTRGTSSAFALALLVTAAAPARGQNDSGPETTRPIVVWHFDGGAEPGLGKLPAATDPGPRPPTFPGFPPTNTARPFSGTGLTVREADLPGVNLRFANGDEITLEAWVRVKELKEGNYAYLVGKGRTRKPGFPEKNQNYALRLHGDKGQARVSFLFASAPENDKPAEWHRGGPSAG